MSVDVVYQHDDGYKYNVVYKSKNKFLSSLKRLKNAEFLHAVDFEVQMVVYPSNLPEYRTARATRMWSDAGCV